MSQEPSGTPTWKRALRVGLLSFVLAVLVNWASSLVLSGVPAAIAFVVILILISMGSIFDMLGTSVTAAETTPLNAMAAKRVQGAKQALWLVRNAERVANFANDVVGDVTGAVTGAAGATFALKITRLFTVGGTWVDDLTSLVVVGLIAALTVGSKAMGKTYAIKQATDVVMLAGRLLYGFERLIGRSVTGGRGSSPSRRRTT